MKPESPLFIKTECPKVAINLHVHHHFQNLQKYTNLVNHYFNDPKHAYHSQIRFSLHTGSDIFTKLASILYLFHKHPVNQNPPEYVKHKQTKQESVEHVVVDRSFDWMLFLVHSHNNLIAATQQHLFKHKSNKTHSR